MDDEKLRELAAKGDEGVDTSDAPELSGWDAAETGRFYRPVRKPVTIRLDADVIECFKRNFGKYQPAINKVLRDYCRAQGLLSANGRLKTAGEKESATNR